MVYGDIGYYDIIVFAAIAIFLIYRLKNVLGRRSGFEKKPHPKGVIKDKSTTKTPDIPQLKDNEKKFSIAYEALQGFEHRKFLEGAKFAFETIINAFNSSDKSTLKNLLTTTVYNNFEKAINEGKNNPNFQFYSLVIDGVEEVVVEKKIIYITLKITSEQFKDNDESTITKKQDIWTFEKNINNNSPTWLLSST